MASPSSAPPSSSDPSAAAAAAASPLELPICDHDDVIDAERAYNDAVRSGGGGQASTAAGAAAAATATATTAEGTPDELAFRLCWTLVHSAWQSDARRGKELAAALRQAAEAAAATTSASASASAAAAAAAAGKGDSADAAASHRVRARDLAYLEAVGEYKTGNLVAARRLLAGILSPNASSSSSSTSPSSSSPSPPSSCRQAEALKRAVDDQIVRDGLLGIGIAGAAAAALACVVAAVFGASRR